MNTRPTKSHSLYLDTDLSTTDLLHITSGAAHAVKMTRPVEIVRQSKCIPKTENHPASIEDDVAATPQLRYKLCIGRSCFLQACKTRRLSCSSYLKLCFSQEPCCAK